MIQIRSFVSAAAALTVAVGLVGLAPAAHAQGNQKSVQNQAEFVKFDEAASTVTVKILKKGKGNTGLLKQFDDKVKNGKEATFNVIPTGSVLTRTSVAVRTMASSATARTCMHMTLMVVHGRLQASPEA